MTERNSAPRDEQPALQRRAGQREDELLPGQSNDDASSDDMRGDAAGSPAGGLGSSGLGGLPRGDGSPSSHAIEDEVPDSPDDDLRDTVEGTHPMSGRSGGAVGGTPAGKRARDH